MLGSGVFLNTSARDDRVLDGGVAHDGYYVESRPVTEPEVIIDWFTQAAGDIPRRPATRQITVRSISGSSVLGVDEGRVPSGPPCC